MGWMRENTPEEPLSYTEYYPPPEDGDFDYPPDAYGVMSWWDYGHWITVSAQRIPFANPFQEGPRPASAYLQSQSENRANLILEALPSLDDEATGIADLSNDDLRSIIEQQSDQEAAEDTRYVVIDDLMAGGKFGAIATWTGPGQNAYYARQQFEVADQTAQLVGVNRRYHTTMLARLYFADATGLAHYRLVHESETVSTFGSVAQQTAGGGFQSTNFINRRINNQIFATVQQRPDLVFYDVRQASRVKTFERVAGAQLTGTANASNGKIGRAHV